MVFSRKKFEEWSHEEGSLRGTVDITAVAGEMVVRLRVKVRVLLSKQNKNCPFLKRIFN